MNSRTLLHRALAIIPGGGQTDTKTPPFRLSGIQPSFFVRGKGAYAQDLDGNWWLDCQMGLAAYVLGYADEKVNSYVAEQCALGSLFSLSSPLELEVAELLLKFFPEFQMVRFGKNGSDATSAAVRIARRHTGRDHVLGCGYHGFQDWSMALRKGVQGIPNAVRQMTHGNETVDISDALAKLQASPAKYAAVIVDTGGYGLPDRHLLHCLQEQSRDNGTIFIMDEVVSGFRVSRRGAMGALDMVPDLLCLGKAVANGFPLSVVIGQEYLMKLVAETGMSSTFGGDCVALAAAKATLEQLYDGRLNASIEKQGTALMEAIASAIGRHGLEGRLHLVGYPALFDLATHADDPDRRPIQRYLMRGLAERSVFWQDSFVLVRDFGPKEVTITAAAVDATLKNLRTTLDAGALEQTDAASISIEQAYLRV